jgi:hypothetical protein
LCDKGLENADLFCISVKCSRLRCLRVIGAIPENLLKTRIRRESAKTGRNSAMKNAAGLVQGSGVFLRAGFGSI